MYGTKLANLLENAVSKKRKLLRSALSFRGAQRGNVGIIFGLSLLPMLLTVGGAVDYGNLVAKKALCQGALDSAILAAATKGSVDKNYLQNIFGANIGASKLTLTNISLSTRTDANNNTVYVGDVSYDIKTSFLGLAGVNMWHAKSHSEASKPPQILTVTFKPTNAQGAFSKDVFIWTKSAAGAITMQQTVMTYRYDGANKVNTPPIGSWSTTFTVPQYYTFGVGLVVYDSTSTGYDGALINPSSKYSDAADASTWIHQTGKCSDGAGQTVNMEDGGDSNYLDFVYNMTCSLGPAPNATARLSN